MSNIDTRRIAERFAGLPVEQRRAVYDKIRTHPSEFYDDAVFGDGGRAKHRDDPAAAAQGVLQNELQPECPPTNVPAASS